MTLPHQLWELHTVKSWAKAFLADLVDSASRPVQGPPGSTEEPVLVHSSFGMDVKFWVGMLDDGYVGVAATMRHEAPGGRVALVNHLLKLDIVASEIPPFVKPGTERG